MQDMWVQDENRIERMGQAKEGKAAKEAKEATEVNEYFNNQQNLFPNIQILIIRSYQ